jgi:hypothetical protein
LARVFQLGHEHGMNTARDNLKGNLRRTVDYMAEKAGLGYLLNEKNDR